MDSAANFRNANISEPRVFGPSQGIQTAVGRIPISSSMTQQQRIASMSTNANVPPVPPKPYASNTGSMQSSMFPSPMGMFGNSFYGNSMYGSHNGYGGMMNPYQRYGGMYGNNYGNSYNNYNNRDPMDPETRFIQLAEESSRPAFQSIESLVMAIGNIAAMLDSTFFALTSSFRAILGVAANFGQLRGVFAQFWSTFALIRGISWLYRK